MVQPTYTGPAHPIGYVELQAVYTGPLDRDEELEMVAALMEKAAREHPGLVVGSRRWERTKDGAGVEYHHLYMGFARRVPAAEPLDPRNLNDAPLPQPGMPEPTDGIMPLGSRETKF